MRGIEGLVSVLDTRSFGSVWYWLVLAGLWSWLGRGALGVPTDLVRRVHRRTRETETAEDGSAIRAEAMLLLDWLSLVIPRWRVDPRDGVILTAVAAFLLSALAGLGFLYDRQFAQALTLLVAPMALLALMRVRLAARLGRVLAEAEAGRTGAVPAAAEASAVMVRHLRGTMALSMAAVALAAIWGTRWLALHPNGL